MFVKVSVLVLCKAGLPIIYPGVNYYSDR